MDDLPNISIVTILHNWEEFFLLFDHHWKTIDYPKDKLEWIIVDDSKKDYSSHVPLDENILYFKVDPNEYLEKITFPKDDDKIIWNYFQRMNMLPNGFKRDYGVGMTSSDYIFHLDYDTLYQPNCIKRKLRFLKDNKLECVYCKDMLCYDIYGKELYKTENKINGYESTLFHTKDFWKKGGFKWEDITNEAVSFYYNKGLDRKMDNYYDTIKLLSIHNLNKYKVAKLTLENMKIKIPNIINTLQVNDHPIKYQLDDLFNDKEINVLGINSELIEILNKDSWNINNLSFKKNEKEKKIIKEIKSFEKMFNLCFVNTTFPIWNIFDKVSFDVIVIESQKNIDQMISILNSKGYIQFENIHINKKYLTE